MDTNKQLLEQEASWCLIEEGYKKDFGKHYEGLFTQGNGYMHIRGSFEEGVSGAVQDEEYLRMPANVTLEKPRHEESKWGTFIPGVVGNHPLLKEEIVNLPYFLYMDFTVAGEKLDMKDSTITEYKRWLDLRDGILYRSFIWHTKTGFELKCLFTRFISLAEKHLCLQKVNIEVLFGEGVIHVDGGIDYGVRTNGYNHFQKINASNEDGDGITVETITDKGNRVRMQSCIKSGSDIPWKVAKKNNKVLLCGSIAIKQGDCLEIQKATAVATDRDLEEGELIYRVSTYLDGFYKEGWDALYRRHVNTWRNKWESSDIKITGDPKAQLAIRMSVYHLIRSNSEEDPRVAICAKGYAGEAYFGRYFWDTEINMLPFYLHTNPKAAKNLILFRYETLEGARKNAKAYGYEGARYAWESSVTGEEQCPNWQYCDHEVHITADVVYALCHYVSSTGDIEFIWDYGIDIMVETARYWRKRINCNKDGQYSLIGVMGPDEYLPMTRNNSFTNRMVKFSLNKTVEYLEYLKNEDQGKYGEVRNRLHLKSSEIELFREFGEKLILPYDELTEVIPQSEDFEHYEDIDFDLIWKDRTKPFGTFLSQERNYRSKALKQADAVELMLLFPKDFTQKQMVHTYDYYEPITTHDSSLSASVHGIMAARMGRMTEFEKFFKKAMEIDLSPESKGAAEGIHIANCGGLWQMIVYGIAGLNSALWNEDVRLEPQLPDGWNALEFTLVWHEKRYRVTINKEKHEIVELMY